MVLISLKSTLGGASGSGGDDGFLFETTASTPVDDLIESLVEIHNARVRSRLIIDSVKDLALYGIMKRLESVGTDEVCLFLVKMQIAFWFAAVSRQSHHRSAQIEKGPNYIADPSRERSGNPPDAQMAEILQREVESLEAYIDKQQVQNKIALTMDCIEEKINNVRGAVAMAYPMGLPEWDSARRVIDDSIDNLKDTNLGSSLIDAKDAALWTCNKEFLRGTLVSDRIGSCNEKTKVIAKLTRKGAGPPARESIISEAERNAMTAYYFQRQEELKRLAQADEDDYLNSDWADPKGMKRNLQGLNDLKTSSLMF
ncbi:hypothetical protein ACHAWU_006393 [Discostella pseudostelligera]|uniref:Uncharacterized protein n=1 Tax=Discostella pseudostelligera TaxID=259834 RepID=A0ABD3N5C1_9STRA